MNPKPANSKKKRAFLHRFLRTQSLEELLPLFVSSISNDDKLFPILPQEIIRPTLESLRRFQQEVGDATYDKQSDISIETAKRKLRDLDGTGLLSYYVSSLSNDRLDYLHIPEEIRATAEYWLDELRLCVTGKNGLFSVEFDPEMFINGFIRYAGGKRLTDTLGENISTENADYFFPDGQCIVELKILQTDFLESNRGKLEAARNEALKKIKITGEMILGTDEVYPKELFDAEFSVLRDALKRITAKANTQIKNTRVLLNEPKATGIVMFLVDGFYSVSPFLTVELLHEPVTRQYSGVDAIIFFNFRRKVTLDLGEGPYDYFIFEPRYKPEPSERFSNFVNKLGFLWFEYLQKLSGVKFSKHLLSYDPLNLSEGVWK